mmetsp:Transcript_70781/g.202809  ORF Transcript_70781/g.202809 Transcript_70781/m.202809 type:complete len:699 (+) Transcript_70781:628-2724(+)
MVHLHGTVSVARRCEALNEGAIHDDVRRHAALPGAEERQSVVQAAGADQGVEHAAEGDGVGQQGAGLHHLGPELPALIDLPDHTVGLDQQPIRLDGRLHRRLLGERGQDLGEALRVPALDASVDHGVEEHLVVEDPGAAGAVQHRQGALGVLGVARLLRHLHHDGDCIVVDRCALLAHLVQNIPTSGVAPAHGADAQRGGAEQAVVGGAVGGHARLLHLGEYAAGAVDVALRTMPLHDGVVGDEVDGAPVLHRTEEREGIVHTAVRDVDVQHAIVQRNVRPRHLRLLGLLQQLQRSADVAIFARRTDEPHVILDVSTGALLKELLRQLAAATLDSELDETADHHVVGLETGGQDLLVQVASELVLAAGRVHLHQGLENREGQHLAAAQVLDDRLGKLQVLRLAALGQEVAAEAFAGEEPSALHLLEQLNGPGAAHLRMQLEQGLEHGVMLGAFLLECQGLELTSQGDVVSLQAIVQESRKALCRDLDLATAQLLEDTLHHLRALGVRNLEQVADNAGRDGHVTVQCSDKRGQGGVELAALQEAAGGQGKATGSGLLLEFGQDPCLVPGRGEGLDEYLARARVRLRLRRRHQALSELGGQGRASRLRDHLDESVHGHGLLVRSGLAREVLGELRDQALGSRGRQRLRELLEYVKWEGPPGPLAVPNLEDVLGLAGRCCRTHCLQGSLALVRDHFDLSGW